MVGLKRKIPGDAISTSKKAKLQGGGSKDAGSVRAKPLRVKTSNVEVDVSDYSSAGSDLSADEMHSEDEENGDLPKIASLPAMNKGLHSATAETSANGIDLNACAQDPL